MARLSDTVSDYTAKNELDVSLKLQPEYNDFLLAQEQWLRRVLQEIAQGGRITSGPSTMLADEYDRAQLKEQYAKAFKDMVRKCWEACWEEFAQGDDGSDT